MIPKLETCIAAVRQGAEAAVILGGRHTQCWLKLYEAWDYRSQETSLSETELQPSYHKQNEYPVLR